MGIKQMEWHIPQSAKQHRGEQTLEGVLILSAAVTWQHWSPGLPFIVLGGFGHNLVLLHRDKCPLCKRDTKHLADVWHTKDAP